MFKLTVLYNEPAQPAVFEDYYFSTHLGIASKLPNVTRVETAKGTATPDGSPLPYYRIAEIWYQDLKTLQASMASPEGKATVSDLANFATGGAKVLISSVD